MAKFGYHRLMKHKWEWVDGDYLPFYEFKCKPTILQVWTEWAEGWDGHLSVCELTEHWGASWRRNIGGKKTEFGRRKKVVDLIETLAKRTRWNLSRALRFIEDNYSGRFDSARKFHQFLSQGGEAEVLATATAQFQ